MASEETSAQQCHDNANNSHKDERDEEGNNFVDRRSRSNQLAIEQAEGERTIAECHESIIIGKVLDGIDYEIFVAIGLTCDVIIAERNDCGV